MVLTIKCEDNANETMINLALTAGGSILNGKNELNDDGVYKGRAYGLVQYNGDFILSDEWFNGQPNDINTIIGAVEKASGIRLKFNSQMLSSRPAIITSYEIVNHEQYNETVGKTMMYMQHVEASYVSNHGAGYPIKG